MSTINDGGPAYPSQSQDKYIVRMPAGLRDSISAAARAAGRSMNAEIVQRLQGVDSRDRLAEIAMQTMLSRTDTNVPTTEFVAGCFAKSAYMIADAMLAERAKVPA